MFGRLWNSDTIRPFYILQMPYCPHLANGAHVAVITFAVDHSQSRNHHVIGSLTRFDEDLILKLERVTINDNEKMYVRVQSVIINLSIIFGSSW